MSAGLDYVSIIREGESRCKEKTRENGLFLGFFLRTRRARPVKRPFWRCSRRPWPLPPPCGAVPAGCRGPVLCAIRRPDSGICRGAPAGTGGKERLLVQLSCGAHRPGARQRPPVPAGAPRHMPESGRRIAQSTGPRQPAGTAPQGGGGGHGRREHRQKGRLTGLARPVLKKKPKNRPFSRVFSLQD